MTRAKVLGAFAASAVLSSCGPLRAAREAVRDRLHGCIDAPAPDPGGARVLTGRLATHRVAGGVPYAVVLPPDVEARELESVIYVLPGRGGTARGVVYDLGFAGFLTQLAQARRLRTAIATIDAGESYFHPRVSGEDRLGVVGDELACRVRALAGGTRLREALMGQSMGGYGALLAAEREPRRYRAVAVAGPALFTSYASERGSVGDAFDDAAQFARYDVIAHAERLRGVPITIRCGASDPFAPAVRAFAAACPHADVRVMPGCHTDGFWRATAPELLAFVARHL